MKTVLLFPFKLLALIFGEFRWKSPNWVLFIDAVRKERPVAFFGAIILLIMVASGYFYWQSLPKPITVTAEIKTPNLTDNYQGAEPDNLYFQFVYDPASFNPQQPQPEGEPSVARIDLVGEEIIEGIRLSPVIKGQWTWLDDRQLQFKPEVDWPAGVEYEVLFNESIFSSETRLSKQAFKFKTRELEISIDSTVLYQDPQEQSIRRVVSTIMFSHPVDKESFEKNIQMGMRPSKSKIDSELKQYVFTISYDYNQREAYITSEPVSLPNESNYMTVQIDKNVKSILGGAGTKEILKDKVVIPDVYSFLKVSDTSTTIIRNQQNEPEQVLMLEFTDPIEEQELLSKLSFHLLPGNGELQGKRHWNGPRKISAAVIDASLKIDLEMIPNQRRSSNLFSFKFDVPENRYLYIKIEKGLTSVNKFVHSSFYDNVLQVPQYPKEVDISGEGSVLTNSGDHKLSILTRGVPGIKYSIGKLLEGQIYHLITQTYGDIQNPEFSNWHINKENLSEFEYEYKNINARHPKDASYSSLDLTRYLPEEENRFGLFFIDVQGWDKKKKRAIYGASDSRLILVTDLGIIVKNNLDQSHELFVQSIQTGQPVAGAKVELLGANGVAIISKITSENGHVSIPVTNTFQREKQPTVYVVKTKNDLSFIPFDRNSRQINLSRFDIGGVYNNSQVSNSLNSYVFTNRGIYRPGDAVKVGFIVKKFDLSNVEGIPLEVVISGPRHNEVKVNRVTLPENGFFDFEFPTMTTTETGRYQVSLHLVRSNKYRGQKIGTAYFKVEEFQPDTMKIESRLVGVANKGWNTETMLEADVSLNNLFGVPAQNRKMKGKLIINPASFSFKQYQQYEFTDPNLNNTQNSFNLNEELAAQQTNADGKASFLLDLERFNAGTYRLKFIAEGFDQAGGRSVTALNSTLISPLKYLIGYKSSGKLAYINANSQRNIEFIAIDNTLNKVELKKLRLKKLAIQKVSTLVKHQNGTYAYQTVKKESVISDLTIGIAQAGYDYAVNTQEPGDFALEIYDAKDRRLSRVEYSVVGFANLAGKIDNNAELDVKLNKADYLAGENIELSIKAPYSGAGLITIETNKVHSFKWFKTDSESSIQTIGIPEDLEGSAYVNVTFVRDVGSKEIFTSPLSYSVQPFSIDKSKRIIDIDLSIAEIVRPGKPMEIGFSTSKKSKIAVFVVDEGILQVAQYQTPDPLAHFMKKQALGVETMQILDLILPEFELLKQLSLPGGGSRSLKALAKNLNPFSRKTDKPAVYWSGIVDASQSKNMVSFDVPNSFAGSLVVMAVAVSEDAMGVARESTIARGPFVISPNVLTQVAPDDAFLVTVGVANLIVGSGKSAPVSIDISTSDHLQLVGMSKIELQIDEGAEAKATFKIQANQMLGAASLIFTARHKDEVLSRNVSLSVRPAMPYYASFESGFEEDATAKLTIHRNMYANLASQRVTASTNPLVLVDGLTSYLDAFPHGCTEQVVSKVFPLVGLMAHPAYAADVENVEKHFEHVIGKLRERQMGDGGFAFWPGHANSAEYPSVYVMHFLIEARALGYPVPRDMIDRGKWYLNNYVQKASTSLAEARDRANAIYLLTRLGDVTTNYLVDLEEYLISQHTEQWKGDLTSSYMAATYQLLRMNDEAEKLISEYKSGARRGRNTDDFHSELAQDAQYIFLLAKHFETRAKNLDSELILQLTDKIFRGQYNTISSAYSILALGAYSKLGLDNRFHEAINFAYLNPEGTELSLQSELKPFQVANYPVAAKKLLIKGDQPLYYLNIQSGFDKNFPETVISEGIEVYRDFIDEQGNKITSFEQGKELKVRLRVRALGNKRLTNIALVDLLPGGFEVIRSSVSRTATNWRAQYIDVREDRVVYYGSFDSSVRELTYKVKLTAAGEFVIPPTYAGSMYDRSIRSISKWGTFKVTQSK